MKTLLSILTMLIVTVSAVAQAPEKMSYQAIVRNITDKLIVNQLIGMRISILQGTATGTVVYSETHKPTTNINGLASIEIGKGTVVSGTFSAINWAGGPYFLKTETDPTGGTTYSITATTELTSVPYALHAKTVQNGDNWGTQTAATDATLAGNGLTATPLKIAQQSAISGQVLKWNGSSWAPANDQTGGGGLTLPFSGTGTSESPLFDITNLGTSGAISTFSSGNYGIWGESGSSSGGIGVYGVNKTNSGTTFGVVGDVYSPIGFSGFFQGGKFYIQGNTGIGTQIPSAKLEVNGQVKITGGTPGDGKVLTSDGVGLATWQTPELNPWSKNNTNIYYNAGNVGIGLNNPAAGLHIKASNFPGSFIYLEANSGSDAGLRFYEGTTAKWHIYNNGAAGGLQITNASAATAIFAKQANAFVGIGTTSPAYTLDVAGATNLIKGLTGSALLCNGSQAIWYDGTYFSWGYQGTYNYFANKVTIGNAANPSYMLYVQGNAYATGNWSSSDIRFKKNVHSIENALSGVMKIRGTSFEFRKNEFKDYQFDEGTRFGFIAQEMEDIFPEVVKTESNGYKSVNYNGMLPVIVEAIKDQQKIINDLKYENEHLKVEYETIKARLEKIENNYLKD